MFQHSVMFSSSLFMISKGWIEEESQWMTQISRLQKLIDRLEKKVCISFLLLVLLFPAKISDPICHNLPQISLFCIKFSLCRKSTSNYHPFSSPQSTQFKTTSSSLSPTNNCEQADLLQVKHCLLSIVNKTWQNSLG